MFEYFQEWEALAGLKVPMNITSDNKTIPSDDVRFEMSENMYCTCKAFFTGCELNCNRTHLVLTATVLSDESPFTSGKLEAILDHKKDMLEEPASLFGTPSPVGFSVALQSAEQRNRSIQSTHGLLSASIKTALVLKAITSFAFVQINRYEPSFMDTVAQIDFTLSAEFELRGQDPITVSLPGFRGEKIAFAEYLLGRDGELFGAAWYPHVAKLVFYPRCAASIIPAGRHLHLIIPKQLGIRLPASGIDTNSSLLEIYSSTSPPKVLFFVFFRMCRP